LSLAAPNPAVLSHLYLSAVLPCLTDLVDQDRESQALINADNASITLVILGGRKATVVMEGGRIQWMSGSEGWSSVTLLFFSNAHLNAFFSGKKWAVPIPIWGGWRIGLLSRFSALSAKLEAILNGDAAVLASAAGRRAYTRLTLIAAGLGLRCLAEGDAISIETLQGLPKGLAAFMIQGEPQSTVWFDHGTADHAAGWSEPPRPPAVRIVFGDMDVAYAAMRDEIDSMAAVGNGQIKVDGLIPLADGLNFMMERWRVYLQP
jgi:hypothetical protein